MSKKLQVAAAAERDPNLTMADVERSRSAVAQALSKKNGPSQIVFVDKELGGDDVDRDSRFTVEMRRIVHEAMNWKQQAESQESAQPMRTKVSQHDYYPDRRPRPMRRGRPVRRAPEPYHYAPMREETPEQVASEYYQQGQPAPPPPHAPMPERQLRFDAPDRHVPNPYALAPSHPAPARETVVFSSLPELMNDFCGYELEYDSVYVADLPNTLHGLVLCSSDRNAFLPASIPSNQSFIVTWRDRSYAVTCSGVKFRLPAGVHVFLPFISTPIQEEEEEEEGKGEPGVTLISPIGDDVFPQGNFPPTT